jgi:hypothetical protein
LKCSTAMRLNCRRVTRMGFWGCLGEQKFSV